MSWETHPQPKPPRHYERGYSVSRAAPFITATSGKAFRRKKSQELHKYGLTLITTLGDGEQRRKMLIERAAPWWNKLSTQIRESHFLEYLQEIAEILQPNRKRNSGENFCYTFNWLQLSSSRTNIWNAKDPWSNPLHLQF